MARTEQELVDLRATAVGALVDYVEAASDAGQAQMMIVGGLMADLQRAMKERSGAAA